MDRKLIWLTKRSCLVRRDDSGQGFYHLFISEGAKLSSSNEVKTCASGHFLKLNVVTNIEVGEVIGVFIADCIRRTQDLVSLSFLLKIYTLDLSSNWVDVRNNGPRQRVPCPKNEALICRLV